MNLFSRTKRTRQTKSLHVFKCGLWKLILITSDSDGRLQLFYRLGESSWLNNVHNNLDRNIQIALDIELYET